MRTTMIFICMTLGLLASKAGFANLSQGNWRWHNNDGTEQTATWKADLNTAVTISDYKAIRLRMEVKNSNDDAKTMDHRLQYATSTTGPWYTISDVTAINAFVMGGDNIFITHGEPTIKLLPDGSNTYVPGMVITHQDELKDTLAGRTRREFEWCIKPTANIRPGTTYYFKSTAGDAPSILPSLTTASGTFQPAPAAISPNGSFENDLNNWQTETLNGSTAIFTVSQTENQIHTGAKSLAVNVTNAGPSGSVTLNSQNITLQDSGVYILRFWALAQNRNALLDIELNGAGTSDYCHYQIYDRFDDTGNGWQYYQYVFKAAPGPLEIKMKFNSNTIYYLDDINILSNKTNPNLDIKSQYVWQNNFNENYGWLSGDNNNPVLLPDGSVAWVYNDSFMGVNDSHSNVLSSSHIINNLVVKRTGDSLTSIYKGTAPNAQALFSPGNGSLFWQSGGVIENGSLKVLLIEINGGNYTGSSWVGTLSLPDLQPTGLTKLPATISLSPNCIVSDGAYNYIYFGESSGTFEMHTIVARVPIGQFDSQTAWEYYLNDGTWSTDYTNAKHIVDGVAAGNVLKLGENNYVMSGVPHLANEIAAWFAPTPYGPWTNKTIIYNIPSQEGILAYQGHLDPTNRDGYYTFTYSVYPFVTEDNGSNGSVPMQIAVKSTYLPIYAQANLLALSPYSGNKPADSLLSFTGNMVGSTAQLNWTSGQGTDDHYEVQRSTDGSSWSLLTTVNGADSISLANYTTTDPSPTAGLNYYRLARYNMDHQLHYSDVLQIDNNGAVSVRLVRFTARVENDSRVQLNWTTATEQDNSGFTIERSVDNQNFTPIGNIKGAGTTSKATNYTFYDKAPLAGINYYRLSYFVGDKSEKSAVRSVQMAPEMTFVVTPNPSHGQIKFILKGHTAERFNVSLMDMAGRVLEQSTLTVNADGRYQLNTRPASGIYILKVSGTGFNKALKVIVE